MATGAPSKITVLLVDDHAVVREGYRRLLEKRGDIVVIGEAANATEAHEQFTSAVAADSRDGHCVAGSERHRSDAAHARAAARNS